MLCSSETRLRLAVHCQGMNRALERARVKSVADLAEAAGVRQAGVRSLAALNDPTQANVLVGSVSDPDATVRRSAVELLAKWKAEQVR